MANDAGRTEHIEAIDLADQVAQLRQAVAEGHVPPAGRLLGLPDLPDDDVWVEIAGAVVITGAPQRTITSWLTRGGPKDAPFPAGYRFLYRLYWPLSTLRAWAADRPDQGEQLRERRS